MIDVPITLESNVVGTFLEPMLLECFQNVIMQRYTITFCKPYKKTLHDKRSYNVRI